MRAIILAVLAAFSLSLSAMAQDAIPPAVTVDEAMPAAEQAPAPSESYRKQVAKRTKKKKKAFSKSSKKRKSKGKAAKKKAKRKARRKYSEF